MKKPIISDKPEELSLNDFIEKNHKIISTIGIFVAITVFTTNLKIEFFSVILSFLFLLMTVMVWLELLGKFPKRVSYRLDWFKSFLTLAFLCFIGYWVIAYNSIWNSLLPIVIALLFVRIISVLIMKFDFYERYCYTKDGREKSLEYFIFWCIFFPLLCYLGIKIGFLVSPSIGEFISQLSSVIK